MVGGSLRVPCTPASSTTKTGRHDISEILLKVTLNTKNQSINESYYFIKCCYFRKLETFKGILSTTIIIFFDHINDLI